jgi:BirA family biotin operon repressor/biotin-[acetyl-CoA-carboxylase] ligase
VQHRLPEELALPLARVGDRLGPLGDRISWYPQVESTNDVALSMAEAGADEGCVVVADSQDSGRGRRGRSWSSPPAAGVYASVILRPRADAARILTLAAGLAIAEGIQAASGLYAGVKWPNDVYIPAPPGVGRKVAGVLAEASTSRASIQYVVLGFGINVRPATYPPDVAARATSIDVELGKSVDRGLVFAECLASLWRRYLDLRDRREPEIIVAWRSRASETLGRRVEWNDRGRQVSGVAEDVSPSGALRVRTPAGLMEIVAGELRWI